MKIVITGGPWCGKTTLSREVQRQWATTHHPHIWHTDYLMLVFGKDQWSEQSEEAMKWLYQPGPWVMEGVTMVRALRKWIKYNLAKPCDIVYYLNRPHTELTPRQQGLLIGVHTIWKEIEVSLLSRGVDIIYPLSH